MHESRKKISALLNRIKRIGFVVLVGLMLLEAVLAIFSLYLVPAYLGL